MPKMLIIAEKPSVARDIASVLKVPKEKEWFESPTVLVSSAIGHLLELGVDEADDDRFKVEKLPVIPENFKLIPVKKTSSQLKLLKTLIDRKDVDCIVNACDAGREGELIFRFIYLHAKSKKPLKRMWLQSMTSEAIKESFSTMKPGSMYENLFKSAISRAEADWLVGINGTRVLSVKGKELTGTWVTYSVGRVQTPALAILTDRELAITSFIPKDFWELHGKFKVAEGEYTGKWYDPDWKKDELNPERDASRFFDKASAESIAKRCKAGKLVEVSEETKPVKRAPPKLYDLTSLQREANSKLGFSAKKTLDLAQAMYEKHKVLTYPRTDSAFLPTDYVSKAKDTVKKLGGISAYTLFSNMIISNSWVRLIKSVFDDSKISDHFAIIPTGTLPSGLTSDESKLYDMVAKRFLSVFYPHAEYLQTKRITVIDKKDHFASSGKILVEAGWLSVYGKVADEDGEDTVLVSVKKGETPVCTEIKLTASQTKPPARFTEATLLGAMEHAGRLVDDEVMAEAMKERGLGTPATRAQIIETLLAPSRDYCRRDKKELVPTAKGMALIAKLRDLGIEVLTQPAMTGDWEHSLKLMEGGKITREDFKKEIQKLTIDIVAKVKKDTTGIKGERMSGKAGTSGEPLATSCPGCGSDTLVLNDKVCSCTECTFKVWREIAGKKLSEKQLLGILSGDIVGPIKGFTSKAGKKFDASLEWKDSKISFVFDSAPVGTASKSSTTENGEFSCPVCSSAMSDDGRKVSCTCGVSFWKTIAQRVLSNEEITQLFDQKETDVLDGFVSKAGKPFSAKLVWEDGKANFKFEDKPKAELSGVALKQACPTCKAEIKESDKFYGCTSCTFKIWKVMAGRDISMSEVTTVLKEGETEKLDGFVSKVGKPFSAKIKLTKTGTEFSFE